SVPILAEVAVGDTFLFDDRVAFRDFPVGGHASFGRPARRADDDPADHTEGFVGKTEVIVRSFGVEGVIVAFTFGDDVAVPRLRALRAARRLRGAGTLFVRNRGMGPGFVLERDGRSLLDEQPDRVEVVVPAFGVHPDGFRPAAGTARPSRARVLTPARSGCRGVRSGGCRRFGPRRR